MSTSSSDLSITVQPLEQTEKISSLLPVSTKSFTSTILGLPTDVVVQGFSDRILILITQIGKIGCFIQSKTIATASTTSFTINDNNSNTLPDPLSSTSLTKLFGSEPCSAYTPLFHLYVSQITSVIHNQVSGEKKIENRPIIVGFGLKLLSSSSSSDVEEDEFDLTPQERERFLEIIKMVEKCRVW